MTAPSMPTDLMWTIDALTFLEEISEAIWEMCWRQEHLLIVEDLPPFDRQALIDEFRKWMRENEGNHADAMKEAFDRLRDYIYLACVEHALTEWETKYMSSYAEVRIRNVTAAMDEIGLGFVLDPVVRGMLRPTGGR